MSDFDKEAEREKLREKYEQEEKEREATEQMSELLLKGATMTNAHCSDCGDPIFRYDGQEFCPSCEKPVNRDGDGAGSAGEGNVEVTSPDDDARVQFGGGDGEDAQQVAGDDGQAEPAASDADAEPQPADTAPTPQAAEPAPTRTPGDSPRIDDSEVPDRDAGDDVTATVEAARASLARSAARFAQAAEGTDDPTAAKEYLSAAREAAAALDELD